MESTKRMRIDDGLKFNKKTPPGYKVLVFPPVNNHRRFLIHKLIQEQFPTLSTFSIGDGEDRRPVICFKSDYIPPPITKQKLPEERSLPKSAAEAKRERRSSVMPSIGIYRPPAARRLEVQTASSHERKQVADSINGKNDCKCQSEMDEIGKKTDSSGASMFRSAITSIRTQNGTGKKNDPEGGKPRPRRPDMKMYVPKARRLANEERKPSRNENGVEETSKSDMPVISERFEPKYGKEEQRISDSEKCSARTVEIVNATSLTPPSTKTGAAAANVSPTSLWIEAQNEIEAEEGKKVSSHPPCEGSSDGSSGPDSVKGSLEKICDKKEKTVRENTDEFDWETIYDDSGDCLEPSLIEQLSLAVGSVTIEKPKSNYDTFKTKTLDMLSNEFPHVIEIYNFPPEFRLQDLMTVFSQFKNAGFEIKWVDDTHALGIFSNSQIVTEVLAFRHPFVKTRMLKDGTALSKEKARRSAEQLLPYKPRPDTCPALARRLVTGALGVKLKTSREEREAERKILKEAREKKRLEAKQREEAWEGNFN